MASQPFTTVAQPQAYEAWDEDRTLFRHILRLDSNTYRPECLFDTPPTNWDERFKGEAEVSPEGNFAFQNRILTGGEPLRLYGKQEGVVVWNGPVIIPTLIDLNRHFHTGERFPADTPLRDRIQTGAVWMSLTPTEMMTLRGAVKMASHTVVLGGLGLGWLLRKVCQKPEVERVILVEESRELLDWYGFKMCRRFEKVVEVRVATAQAATPRPSPARLFPRRSSPHTRNSSLCRWCAQSHTQSARSGYVFLREGLPVAAGRTARLLLRSAAVMAPRQAAYPLNRC
jgi:hypothetical protein